MKSCDDIRELLVDYADGELSKDVAREVAEHLAQCPACQAKVKGLARSLEVTRAIWQAAEGTVSAGLHGKRGQTPGKWDRHSAHRVASEPVPFTQEKGSDPFFRYAAVAAVVAVVGVGAMIWSLHGRQPAPTLAQMESQIAQAAEAARILVAADILAAQEGGEKAAREQYLLIIESYKNTPSAKEGLARIKSNERRI